MRPSVAQAAMIGNPVSFPRVRLLAERYEREGGSFQVVRVTEQAIMDAMLLANRHGHIAWHPRGGMPGRTAGGYGTGPAGQGRIRRARRHGP